MNSKSVKCYMKKQWKYRTGHIPICGTNVADKKFVGKLFCASRCWVFGFTIETSTLEYLKMPSIVLVIGYKTSK